MKEGLQELLRQGNLWQASAMGQGAATGIPSGFPELDQRLADGGWPRGGVTELLHDRPGMGELRLLLPAMVNLSRQDNRWLLWLAPPHIPYAPALSAAGLNLSRLLVIRAGPEADRLWAMEQALTSGGCSALLAWPAPDLQPRSLRRLQLAARDNRSWTVLFRPARAARQPSPAELRLLLLPAPPAALSDHSRLRVQILKRRGGWATEPLVLTLEDGLNRITPAARDLVVPGTDAPDRPATRPAAPRPVMRPSPERP